MIPQRSEMLPQPSEIIPQPSEIIPRPTEMVPRPTEMVSYLAEMTKQYWGTISADDNSNITRNFTKFTIKIMLYLLN